jgi:hypothetical protein
MKYLAVCKFDEYQHYKNRKPPWVKFYVKMLDPQHPLNELPVSTRYLFDRLLLLAAEYENAIPNDSELISNLLRMESGTCREGLDQLLKGRWIKEKGTKRSASKRASKVATRFEHQRQRTETETESASARPRNPVWDALVDGLGQPQTKSERGRFNRAVKELEDIEATPEDIAQRCSVYRRRWPNITLTPQALTSNWTNLEQPKLVAVAPVEEVVDLPEISEVERRANLERLNSMMGNMGRSL